jgi:phosphatidylserine/phosphatidylglycerophosphate/cardiolipin synthase-like enzyme
MHWNAMVAHGAPLCQEEGLWGTALCLAVKTISLGMDLVAYTFTSALPSQWAAIASAWLAKASIAHELVSLKLQATRDLASRHLNGMHSDMFVYLSDAAESHRAAFVKAFPKHADLLPAGDGAGFFATLAFLAMAFVVMWLCRCALRTLRRGPEVLFFPDASGNNVARICQEISQARRRIWLAMFAFTDDLLSEELVRAYHRGIDVRVIVDDEQSEMRGADAQWLANSGIPITTDRSRARMHHKFMVSDNKVMTGSFNWTRQASTTNNENLCILKDSAVVKLFATEFAKLWSRFHSRGGRLKRGARARGRCHTPPPSRSH